MTSTYKGYTVSKNRLTGRFYAYPVNDLTTCRKIVCDTAMELRAAIDEATKGRSLDPWELPRQSA